MQRKRWGLALFGMGAAYIFGASWLAMWWIAPVWRNTPAAQFDALSKKIEAAQIGDMPSFQTTMQMGLNGLQKSDAATKHMIIISDGDASAPTQQLLKDFNTSGVSISTVTVFPHGNQPTGVMPSIANVTGGRHYYPRDPEQLPYPMQTGSGTWDLMPGATYTGKGASISWGGQAVGTVRLGRNDADYAFGDVLDATAWSAWRTKGASRSASV